MGHKQLQAAAWAVCLATAGAEADQNVGVLDPLPDPDVSGGGATPAFEALHPPEDRGANGAAGTFTASSLPPLPLPGDQRVCYDRFCGNCVDISVAEDPCQPRFRSHILFGAEGSLHCVRCPTRPIPPPRPPPLQPILCGDDEIGGGHEDCEACPDGEVPNEDRTACVACAYGEASPGKCEEPFRFRIGRCTRPVDFLHPVVMRHLPLHVNVVVESTDEDGGRIVRSFFAVDMKDAVVQAGLYLANPSRIWDPGGAARATFTDGEVRTDGNVGDCDYTMHVSELRYETVKSRIEAYDWTDYHLVAAFPGRDGYGTCATWVDSVLAPGTGI